MLPYVLFRMHHGERCGERNLFCRGRAGNRAATKYHYAPMRHTDATNGNFMKHTDATNGNFEIEAARPTTMETLPWLAFSR